MTTVWFVGSEKQVNGNDSNGVFTSLFVVVVHFMLLGARVVEVAGST